MIAEFSPYISGFIIAYSILVVAASSPGPSVAMLIGIAIDQGRTAALTATLGVAFGSITINILTLLGVGFLLSQAAWAMTLLRVIGGLYLLYLAFGAFKKAFSPTSLIPTAAKQTPLFQHFVKAYLLQVTNPKAIAFWLAIASVGAVEGASLLVVGGFVFGAFIISFTCHGARALALSVERVRKGYVAARRWVELCLGGVFVFAAYKVVTSSE